MPTHVGVRSERRLIDCLLFSPEDAVTRVQQAFAVEKFLLNGSFVVVSRRAFRRSFQLTPCGSVPHLRKLSNFRVSGYVLNRVGGRSHVARTPENIEAVRSSFLRFPKRAARKHAAALQLSDQRAWRIFHQNLRFHPYKMTVIQDVFENYQQNSMDICENIL
ncbi:hypothetical protein PR048_011059 [Dryococelus australis]|uniref:Uncharacterized protein n=1 Tax=Dryococelus australis TaxID=614101 RepID=A0ABQ9HKI0_9NEOP|nr:hypothetical protein PR048_011059 [Dryococelus australis]